ncbi:MAG: sulfatase-like hydrolase/transferase [Ruminococcus sp.]
MSNKNSKKNKSSKPGISKNKLISSLLGGFVPSFVLLICSTISVFFSNATEFKFGVWDFLPAFLLISLAVFAVSTLLLLFTKGLFRKIIFSLLVWLTVCGFLQSVVTTLTFQGIPGDGNAPVTPEWWVIADFLVWALLLVVAIWFGALSKKAPSVQKIMSFVLVLVAIMQIFSILPSAVTYATERSDTPEEKVETFLSTKDMYTLSEKDNIVVFILDRFDNEYYNELLRYDPDFFKDYDGFTYYRDNVTTYPRTYPASTSLATGVNSDFSTSRLEYFQKAYSSSNFLKDLQSNNYNINLYIPGFYAYEDASVMEGLVNNVDTANRKVITSKSDLTGNMFLLSSYFWAPDILKSQKVSSSYFTNVVQIQGSKPKYVDNDDASVYRGLVNEGLSLRSDKNNFSMYHLRGCHSPFTMDENCQLYEDYENAGITSLQQTRGCFKIVGDFIAQMKELGIYDDATIIITGDHGRLNYDSKTYDEAVVTALLVKEKGEHGTAFKTSSAQVSQENFHATIIKSAGISTTHDYGRAYSEVPEGETVVRYNYFQLRSNGNNDDVNQTYTIIGDANDFANWKLTDSQNIGYVYK